MTMPAGVYYIGDLCYVFGDTEWDQMSESGSDRHPVVKRGDVANGEFVLEDGRRFARYSTKYGDGGYGTNTGSNLSVDSGTIGCVLMSDLSTVDMKEINRLGMIAVIEEPFETSGEYDVNGFVDGWDGVIRFGPVEVYTNDYDPFEDEDEDESY